MCNSVCSELAIPAMCRSIDLNPLELYIPGCGMTIRRHHTVCMRAKLGEIPSALKCEDYMCNNDGSESVIRVLRRSVEGAVGGSCVVEVR